ncbi:hypothetical protein Pryu01_00475 [Paraliobacillus ryukyuensis]|uniref:Uncharacterized protein n=1 Tax=Paraliobacillus ryukyuensis TaxID=200904 RepID=A0A366EGC3_9BACI|nr:hypothetical protein [Paraliobacillus ryukyuensis]RBP01452.1 hypothetical protein DES48_101189 [Paraliobacillus ryukyuensis]
MNQFLKNFLKVLGIIAIAVPLLWISFLGIVETAFTVQADFYVPFILFLDISVLFFISNLFFRFLQPKTLKYSLFIFVLITFTSLVTYLVV